MTLADELVARAERREATFGIVGLGYVGLPLAVELARAGFRVIGYDVSQRVVEGLNAGRSHIKDVSDHEVAELRRDKRFEATTDGSRLAACGQDKTVRMWEVKAKEPQAEKAA